MGSSWAWLYFLASLANIWSVYIPNHPLEFLTKPLLMALLSVYFWRRVRPSLFGLGGWVLLGLLCSAVGDICLLWSDDLSFLLGLTAFLLAHLFYLTGFVRYKAAGRGGLWLWPLPVASALLLWIAVNSFLRNDVHGLRLPVAAYTAIIISMSLSALLLRSKVGRSGNTLIVGVFLFMFSDSVIALNKFKPELGIWHPLVIIMVTYLAGQWLIARGSVRIIEHRISGSVEAA